MWVEREATVETREVGKKRSSGDNGRKEAEVTMKGEKGRQGRPSTTREAENDRRETENERSDKGDREHLGGVDVRIDRVPPGLSQLQLHKPHAGPRRLSRGHGTLL